MRREIVAALLLVVAPSTGYLISAPTILRGDNMVTSSRCAHAGLQMNIKDDDEKKQKRPLTERESLYATPSFELDATSITALLGAAIAFQFFVLANL